jgi:2-methylcitrate dehydratase PrpD
MARIGAAAPSTTTAIARFVDALSFEQLPPEVVARVRACVVDTLAVSIAAKGVEGPAEALARFCATRDRAAGSTVWATGAPARPPDATLANATLARALDWDDIFDHGPVHVGAAVVPAALALAERFGTASGRELIAALAAGAELQCRLGAACARAEDAAERPAVLSSQLCGYFAAAAVSAKLLGLGERRTAAALGLALMHAAGTMAAVASGARDGKALYAGLSGQGGAQSALLAERGLAAMADPFGGPDGLFERHFGAALAADVLVGGLGDEFRMLETGVKAWPGTKVGHPFLEAALLIRPALGPAEQVEAVEIEVGRWSSWFCEPLAERSRPRSPSDAKNSIPWLVACALIRGEVSPDCFEERALHDPALLDAAARVRPVRRSELSTELGYEPAVVRVVLADGRTLGEQVEVPLGDHRRPLGARALEKKLRACHASRRGATADALADLGAGLVDGVDAAALVRHAVAA